MTATRTLSFRLYPSRLQAEAMARKHALLKDLWNAALEERIGAFRKGVRLRYGDQAAAIKHVRLDVGGWQGLVHTHEAQVVLKRLDLAFQSFFRRLKAGATPGFLRFKSADRFPGWGYQEHGNGFHVEMREGWRHGHVRLFGIGRMRMRGIARTPGRICKADVLRDAFGWRLSVVVETDCAMRAPAAGPAAGIDWGVSTFATLALEDGSFREIENPRHLDAEAEGLRERGRRLSALSRARRISRRGAQRARRALARAPAEGIAQEGLLAQDLGAAGRAPPADRHRSAGGAGHDGLRPRHGRGPGPQRGPEGGPEQIDPGHGPGRVPEHAPIQSGRGWFGVS